MLRLCLFQPDQAANLGSILRLTACFGMACEIIGPCGFPMDHSRLRRAGMDYIQHADYRLHTSWADFQAWRGQQSASGRLVLLTTKAAQPLPKFRFEPGDHLLFGRESAGAPDYVHNAADHRLVIPMRPETRSLNLAQSAAITLAEAMRQTNQWPGVTDQEQRPHGAVADRAAPLPLAADSPTS
ncbi:MAG: tRNA (cytidine(34)-2'-O)-methyltransferase [Pseudomonadota bacterium]